MLSQLLRPATSLLLLGAAVLAYEGDAPGAVDAPDPVRYGRDIRPLLSDRCFVCHGPDAAARKAELRLDVRAEATADRGGFAALVPGDAGASELVRRVTSDDPDERMPPPGSHRNELTEDEVGLLRRWVDAGAAYEEHWSFVPPTRPALPAALGASWPRGPIDRFVLASLERAGLEPSPEAEPEVLLRRVFLDLTGLPPTPEELDGFLADTRPDAYERQVERLLHEEPWVSRYAERMATPWLDAARYADTNGTHMDAGRQMWAWRDWVLAAIREGMPFDRFLTEQLAGDLLPGATRAQLVASGFNRNHVITDEGGAIDEEYLVEYAVDRTDTTSSVFLGLTMRCARCHEHKFDPIDQEDYYGLFAFFNSNEEPGLYTQETDPNRSFEPFMAVPSPEQESRLAEVEAALERERGELGQISPEDAARLAGFLECAADDAGVVWAPVQVAAVSAGEGATLAVQPDGSVLATGENPDTDEHQIVLRTDGTGLRVILLEALGDPTLFEGRVGRAPNGNAVLSSIAVEAVSVRDPGRREPVSLGWAWADHEQENGDHDVVNALDPDPARGWVVDGHRTPGGRTALWLADAPFGFEGGTELRVTLSYRSIYPRHVLGRVRLSVGTLDEQALAKLPVADSRWYGTWPYTPEGRYTGYDQVFGPEADAGIDFAKEYPPDGYGWVLVGDERGGRDGVLFKELPVGEKVSFVGKRLFVPSRRTLEVSLGSDDGVMVWLDGALVHENRVDRGVAPDQDRFELELGAGLHTVVAKIVNTGGPGGFYWEQSEPGPAFAGALTWALVPERARNNGADDLASRVAAGWLATHSAEYRAGLERVTGLEREAAELDAAIPRTMIMREREEPRPTFLLMRGQYDQPDPDRPVERRVPRALGALPAGAPANRLGLAQWMTSDSNPLVARVRVNRLWEIVFGTGLVATSEDFGLQGEWPSHPELLDWLAVEFRESGWDEKRLVRAIVTSTTYRQASRRRPEAATDRDNRLLSCYPRRRLGAEEVRDSALYVAGLLTEQFGGPSVKPYQPPGLWKEVAMPQSNTRTFMRGGPEDLWRRSLYTYWKRAAPPPSLLTFDAPTREFCNIRRATTNTPLQALVLWNDEQFVEAARVLAQRVLAEMAPVGAVTQSGSANGSVDVDAWRIARLFRRAAGRAPEPRELEGMRAALDAWRERYVAAPEDARELFEVGEAPLPAEYDAPELAAWTLLSNTVLSLDAVISRS